MKRFTIEHLPEEDRDFEIEGKSWKRFCYDAFNSEYQGRIEIFVNDQSSAWHYYQLEPGKHDRARVFYGPIKTKGITNPRETTLTKEISVAAEKCHNWLKKQPEKHWKRLASPIFKGEAVERAVHA